MKSKQNLGLLKIFKFEDDEGRKIAHMDYIDPEGKLNTFRTFVGIQEKEGKPILETWQTEETDGYEFNITNKQN